MFSIYLPLGFEHIVSMAGFDHLLFIMVLCAAYSRQEWRTVLVLLTGFTLGHSLTLALTALGAVSISPRLVELLIPATILATSLANVLLDRNLPVHKDGASLWQQKWPFVMAALFGLVHGCGFAGYFGMMLGDEASIIGPLFAFNLGLELGQIFTVLLFYALFYMLAKIRPLSQRDWCLFVSGAGAGLAIKLILENLPT